MRDAQLTTDLVVGVLGMSASYINQFLLLLSVCLSACLSAPAGYFRSCGKAIRSVAGRVRGTPSDAPEDHGKKPTSGGDRSSHAGRAEAVRRVDHTRRRSVPISLKPLCGPTTTHIFALAARVRVVCVCADLARSIESTTIALLARLSGLMEPLCEFVKTKPVWGTCAGAILLAQVVSNPKRGGQELFGGVSVKITRNGWGSQVRYDVTRTKVIGLTECFVFFYYRLNLLRPHSRSAGSETLTDPSSEFSSAHR
jgi:hypothetical protein